jgi:dihydrofolate synthase/folylpolyglutamate synthase
MIVEKLISRIERLHPRLIDLSLDRLRVLLSRLGNPQCRLPPIIHVAGTNGKGSTCAFLRAMAEAAGLRVHVYTSPHLVHLNERIRLAGALVSDDYFAATLERIECANDGGPISIFEVITAAAFDMFAKTPADLCVLEVGLGGRRDATNIIEKAAASAITSISRDHVELLGPTLENITREKAGIMRNAIPVAIGRQTLSVEEQLLCHARGVGAPVLIRGRDWEVDQEGGQLRYRDASGGVDIPAPSLGGEFQLDNAGIALTALRAARIKHDVAGLAQAEWPARMQHLQGKLATHLPVDWELWLDGGHNPGASYALATHLQGWTDRPVHLVIGMRQAKNPAEFLRPLLPLATTVWAVSEPGQHSALSVEAIVAASGGIARPGPQIEDALRNIPRGDGPARVLICGSLYLAAEVLKLDLDRV